MYLILLPRGWVFVGECREDNGTLFVTNASVIRRWGTTKGLPELANNGPLDSTVLDGKCELEFPMTAVIGKIKCSKEAWAKY